MAESNIGDRQEHTKSWSGLLAAEHLGVLKVIGLNRLRCKTLYY